jgi:hypothetical protein
MTELTDVVAHGKVGESRGTSDFEAGLSASEDIPGHSVNNGICEDKRDCTYLKGLFHNCPTQDHR